MNVYFNDLRRVHLVTSNIFLPSILSLLKPTHQANLLKAYFVICLYVFVSQGRPSLDIKAFFEGTSVDPKPPSDSASGEQVGNPWYTVLSATILHKDEHHVKTERALAHSAALYGYRAPKYFKDTGLEGAEYMDGTLFVRAGGLLMDVMKWDRLNVGKADGRTKEDEEAALGWDFEGLWWE